jgi:hypothetical protein
MHLEDPNKDIESVFLFSAASTSIDPGDSTPTSKQAQNEGLIRLQSEMVYSV